jgi:hypothetical protein
MVLPEKLDAVSIAETLELTIWVHTQAAQDFHLHHRTIASALQAAASCVPAV